MEAASVGRRLVVRRNPVAYLSRLSLVLFLAVVCGLAPLLIDGIGRDQLRFYGVAVLGLLAWACMAGP